MLEGFAVKESIEHCPGEGASVLLTLIVFSQRTDGLFLVSQESLKLLSPFERGLYDFDPSAAGET